MNKLKPIFLKNEKEFKKLSKEKSFLSVIDVFERQLKELIFIDQPKFIGQEKKKVYQNSEFKEFVKKKKNDFYYIYFPWKHTIVKSVKERDFYELKTNRNRDLILPEDQKKLYNCGIAILGLSVGSNIALTLALSGIARKMIIADCDELETTNLNRILAGIHEIGLNKTLLTAQKLYEQNPYLKLTLLPKGISKKNLEKLLEKKEIDCIIEEIDNLFLKVQIRDLAIKYKVPVIMITDNGEGVVLHVERYDLGYNMVFGKEADYWLKKFSKPLTKKEIGEIICREIVGGKEKVDRNMLLSVQKVVENKLISWPQLGTAALLAGVVTTILIKNIVSGQNKRSYIKKYINILT